MPKKDRKTTLTLNHVVTKIIIDLVITPAIKITTTPTDRETILSRHREKTFRSQIHKITTTDIGHQNIRNPTRNPIDITKNSEI